MGNESCVFAFYLQANTEQKEIALCKAYLQPVLSVFTGWSYTGFSIRERKIEGLRAANFSCCSVTILFLALLEEEEEGGMRPENFY